MLRLLLPALLLSAPLASAEIGAPDDWMKSNSQPKGYDREALSREISETLQLLEDLGIQHAQAPVSEQAEVWASGERDFHLKKGLVKDFRTAMERLGQARAWEEKLPVLQAAVESLGRGDARRKDKERELRKSAEKVQELREDARDELRGWHKDRSAEFLDSFRNWLSVGEGMLRKENEKRAKALPAPSSPIPVSAAVQVSGSAK